MIALAAAMVFTGCEAYVVEHRRPVRTYGYYGHRDYYAEDRPYYGYRRYASTRSPYYGYRRGSYHRPAGTVVIGRTGPYYRAGYHRGR